MLMKNKWGVSGTTYENPDGKQDKVRFYGLPPAYNPMKAHMALRISQVWPKVEFICVDCFGQNYNPSYARMNPNMTIPICKIDDKIITDSAVLIEYLRANYPGTGDEQATSKGKAGDVKKFCELVQQWDEGLYSFGGMARENKEGMGAIGNMFRLLQLRRHCSDALKAPEEKLLDGTPLMTAYENKIAYINTYTATVDCAIGPEKKARMDNNEQVVENIFSSASSLIKQNGGPFLFGPHLTSADCYFAAYFFRIREVRNTVRNETMDYFFEKYTGVQAYWERFESFPESKVITDYNKFWALRYAVKQCMPCKIIFMKLGLYRAPALPDSSERRIKEAMGTITAKKKQ